LESQAGDEDTAAATQVFTQTLKVHLHVVYSALPEIAFELNILTVPEFA
jgi:hypothetical protein